MKASQRAYRGRTTSRIHDSNERDARNSSRDEVSLVHGLGQRRSDRAAGQVVLGGYRRGGAVTAGGHQLA